MGVLDAPLVEVVIGLVVVWFTAAVAASGLVELAGTLLGFRAKHLWRVLGRALSQPGDSAQPAAATEAFGLARVRPQELARDNDVVGGFVTNLPGVTPADMKRVKLIEPENAAAALAAIRGQAGFAATQLGELYGNLPPEVRDQADEAKRWFQDWFDGYMARASAVFRQSMRWWAVPAAVVVVGVCGIDSIALAEALFEDPTQRALVVAEAEQAVADGDTGCTPADQGDGDDPEAALEERLDCVRDVGDDIEGLQVSVWQSGGDDLDGWAVPGFLVSVAAVSAGAPFWFSILKQAMALRRPPT
jgi:hypothetical protein